MSGLRIGGLDLVKWVGCIYFNSSTCDLTLRCHNCALTYGLFVEITSTALVHFSVSASNMVQSTESQSQLTVYVRCTVHMT